MDNECKGGGGGGVCVYLFVYMLYMRTSGFSLLTCFLPLYGMYDIVSLLHCKQLQSTVIMLLNDTNGLLTHVAYIFCVDKAI